MYFRYTILKSIFRLSSFIEFTIHSLNKSGGGLVKKCLAKVNEFILSSQKRKNCHQFIGKEFGPLILRVTRALSILAILFVNSTNSSMAAMMMCYINFQCLVIEGHSRSGLQHAFRCCFIKNYIRLSFQSQAVRHIFTDLQITYMQAWFWCLKKYSRSPSRVCQASRFVRTMQHNFKGGSIHNFVYECFSTFRRPRAVTIFSHRLE